MNKTGKATEPSMDEILASIRKIIAEEPSTPRSKSAPAVRRPEPVSAEMASPGTTSSGVSRTPIPLDDDLDDLIDGPATPSAPMAQPGAAAPNPPVTAAAARLANKSPSAEASTSQDTGARARAEPAEPPAANGSSHDDPIEDMLKPGDLGAVVPRRETPSGMAATGRSSIRLAADQPQAARPASERAALEPRSEATQAPVPARPAPAAPRPDAKPTVAASPTEAATTPTAIANGAVRASQRFALPEAAVRETAEPTSDREPRPAGSDRPSTPPSRASEPDLDPALSAPLAAFSASLASQAGRVEKGAKPDAQRPAAGPDPKTAEKPAVRAAEAVTEPAPPARTAEAGASSPAPGSPSPEKPTASAAPQLVVAQGAAAPNQAAVRPSASPAASIAPTHPAPSETATQAPAPVPVPASVPAMMVPGNPILAPAATRTLEDTVAELLRPMLRQWLDANMPRIVEKALRIELAQAPAKTTVVMKKPPSEG
jgi:cell pole-organizing protein PopZ